MKGRKRHIVVDILDNLLHVQVHVMNLHDLSMVFLFWLSLPMGATVDRGRFESDNSPRLSCCRRKPQCISFYLSPLTTRLLSTDFTLWLLRTISIARSMLCWESTTPLSFTTPLVVVTLI